jgi:hypothetical protein
MKYLVYFALVVFGSVSNADSDVIKPINTLTPAKGITSVSGLDFDYAVLDRGWSTTGELLPKFKVEAEKSFILSYMVRNQVDRSQISTLWNDVRSDADKKCLELGQIEYKGQIASFDQSYTTTLSAKIVNTSEPTRAGTVALSANCVIDVTAIK